MTRLDKQFAVLFILIIINNLFWWNLAHGYEHDIKTEKVVSEVYKDEALDQNSLYEGAQNDLARLKKDLANVRRQLALSTEREKAARVRASRSRRVESPKVTVPHQQRSSSPSGNLSGGALRDITMYCTGSITASGKTPHPGMVATISRSIPFGTRISIDGLGVYVVEDRIGHGSEFDLYTNSCSEARNFGRKHLRVTILG